MRMISSYRRVACKCSDCFSRREVSGEGELVVLHNLRVHRDRSLALPPKGDEVRDLFSTGIGVVADPQAVAEGPQGHPGGRRADVSAR